MNETPKERAEKIWHELQKTTLRTPQVMLIAAQIEEAVKEDRAKHNERTQDVVNDIRNAALEEAAKIAEDSPWANFDRATLHGLAESIRAMKMGGKKL